MFIGGAFTPVIYSSKLFGTDSTISVTYSDAANPAKVSSFLIYWLKKLILFSQYTAETLLTLQSAQVIQTISGLHLLIGNVAFLMAYTISR